MSGDIEKIARNIPEPSPMVAAREAAKLLYEKYQVEEALGRNCGALFLEWTKEVFYGMLVKDHLPVFDFVWQELRTRGYKSRKTALVYGDIDVSTWAEQVGSKQILVYIRHCSCADDNTFLFIKDDPMPEYTTLNFMTFRAVTVWPRQVNYPRSWGDFMKNIPRYPSLNTHRRAKFDYGYGDERDTGYVFKYQTILKEGRVEGAHYSEPRILRALDVLQEIQGELNNPEDEAEGER